VVDIIHSGVREGERCWEKEGVGVRCGGRCTINTKCSSVLSYHACRIGERGHKGGKGKRGEKSEGGMELCGEGSADA